MESSDNWLMHRSHEGMRSVAGNYPIELINASKDDSRKAYRWGERYDHIYLDRKYQKRYTKPVIENMYRNGGWHFEDSVLPVVVLSKTNRVQDMPEHVVNWYFGFAGYFKRRRYRDAALLNRKLKRWLWPKAL